MPPNKFSRGNHRKSRREARKQEAQVLEPRTQGDYIRPPRSESEPEPPIVEAPTDTTRLYIYTWMQGSLLVEFLMLHLVLLHPDRADGWYLLAKVDCADGSAHIHFDDDGANRNAKVIRVLDSAGDLWTAYDETYSVMFDERHERERRFEDALKHSNRRRPTRDLPQADLPPDWDAEG